MIRKGGYINNHVKPEEGLIIYPHAMWAMGYYGKWDVRFEKTQYVAHNFDTYINRPHTLCLPSSIDGVQYWVMPQVLIPKIREFLAKGYESIFFLETRANSNVRNVILNVMRSEGYILSEKIQHHPHDAIYYYKK